MLTEIVEGDERQKYKGNRKETILKKGIARIKREKIGNKKARETVGEDKECRMKRKMQWDENKGNKTNQ